MQNKRVKILHTGIDAFTYKEALDDIRLFLSSSRGHQIVTLNLEMVVRAEKDIVFRKIIEEADLVVADGAGTLSVNNFLEAKKGDFLPDLGKLFLIALNSIFFPSRIKSSLPEKISGIDLIYAICGSDFIKGEKIYLLGAKEGIAKKAGEVLQKKYPEIEIAGAEMGIDEKFSAENNRQLVERINVKSPAIIFVALGAPKQEKWIYENLKKMPSVRLAMGVGGSFDIISGKVRRAPKIFQSHSLEWLWRLLQEPKRIGRIYNATFKMVWLIFRDKKDKMEG